MAYNGIMDAAKKLKIYRTLHLLNLSFANIVRHCRTLQEANFVGPKFTRLFQGLAQELQCEMNERLLNRLHDIEMEGWKEHGKTRIANERELRSVRREHKKS